MLSGFIPSLGKHQESLWGKSKVMRLVERSTKIEDFPACLRIIAQDTPFLNKVGPAQSTLRDLWSHLLTSGAGISAVIEDQGTSSPKVVGFAMSIFVTDAFISECTKNPDQYVLHGLLEHWAKGQSAVLDYAAIKRGNSGNGLNLLGLHTSWIDKYDDSLNGPNDWRMIVRDKMRDSLYRYHAGFRLKSLFKEIYGDEERDRYLSFGMNLWPNKEFYDKRDALINDRDWIKRQPYLVGIRNFEALSPDKELQFARPLFANYQEPRFHFTRSQQEVLLQASFGKTDIDIAKALGISNASVRQLWKRIFDQVDFEAIVEASPDGNSSEGDESWGKTKKYRVVEYLRQHPSELRPHLRSKS